MSKIITLFNHKGGVSKTTTTFNLGWKLAQMGHSTLIVDTDSQCNLTGLCMNLDNDVPLDELYQRKDVVDVWTALQPAFAGEPEPIAPAKCYTISTCDGLYLLPCNVRFDEYDSTMNIAQEFNGSMALIKNIPGAFRSLINKTAEDLSVEYILVDMSPSITALNANIFMSSDYFILPCAPDYFCDMAIQSLANILPRWSEMYKKMGQNKLFESAQYPVPVEPPKFIGVIHQRYRPRNSSPARSFQQWIDTINDTVINRLVPVLRQNNMLQYSIRDGYTLSSISDFNSLIAKSQQYNTPVFCLTPEQIQQTGSVLETMLDAQRVFDGVFVDMAEKLIEYAT